MQNLMRRGFDLGPAPDGASAPSNQAKNWSQGSPIFLPNICAPMLAAQQSNIQQSESLVLAALDDSNIDELFYEPPYSERIEPRFVMMGSAFNQGDDQEIESVMFDAMENEDVIAEDLWMKVSWLSFYEEDASLRFRFSFGVDLAEDVAADVIRQRAAADLASAIFPESAVITDNPDLLKQISAATAKTQPNFVERIVYFNAPNGGAYLHHDLERGHAGVVYAQLTGMTLWLALPCWQLVQEIQSFIQLGQLPLSLTAEQAEELTLLNEDCTALENALNSFANDAVIHLLNETPEFVQYLIKQGHYRILQPGDALLLPQPDQRHCCWHSVFCLGDEMGQALSFAIR